MRVLGELRREPLTGPVPVDEVDLLVGRVGADEKRPLPLELQTSSFASAALGVVEQQRPASPLPFSGPVPSHAFAASVGLIVIFHGPLAGTLKATLWSTRSNSTRPGVLAARP